MSRPLQAIIRLDALRYNYRLARQLQGGRALAVVKANAYGHGAIACARALHDEADGFAVACLEEAVALRDAGITRPILLLEGVFEAAELLEVARFELWLGVHHVAQIDMLEAAKLTVPVHVWLKMDSGMHRLGFFPADYRAAYARLAACPQVASIVHMTHFARADEPGEPSTAQQMYLFHTVLDGLPGEVSWSNSAGILNLPANGTHWIRPGIMLYGCTPFGEGHSAASALRPVMQLQSQIFAVRELPTGEALGYGARFVTERPTRVGTVACGYADGYPCVAPSGTPVLVDGVMARVIGRVSMDMLTVDLSDLPQAGCGSTVTLWGDGLSVDTVARAAGTIGYELLCNVKRAYFTWL